MKWLMTAAHPYNPRLPVPHNRPLNRPHLRRRLPPRPSPRLPNHELYPRVLLHAPGQPRSAFRWDRLSSTAEAASGCRRQDAPRGVPVDGEGGATGWDCACCCGAGEDAGGCVGDGEDVRAEGEDGVCFYLRTYLGT